MAAYQDPPSDGKRAATALCARLWPHLREDWVLHADPHLVALSRPASVPVGPSQGADGAAPVDLTSRLRAHLAEREGCDPAGLYLGVHVQLDARTSGVIVYARRPEANRVLAPQLEGEPRRKRFVAAVSGFSGEEEERLETYLAGRPPKVVSPRARGAARARTRVRVLSRAEDRALVELEIVEGRARQLRVQLAHVGWPVVGDLEHGGLPAPRLMLHLQSLEVDHPETGKPLHLSTPVPEMMRHWVECGDAYRDIDAQLVEHAADKRYGLRHDCAGARATTAFRLLHGRGDGAASIEADVYGSHVVLHTRGQLSHERHVAQTLVEFGFAGVYVKRHPKGPSALGEVSEALAPSEPLLGEPAPDELTVHEHGIPYLVRLGDGLSTGLFLDQRDNRARVRSWAKDASVLNLFAYTCPFSVAAAHGGAKRTVSVDASGAALDWGRRNLALGEHAGSHEFRKADVFEVLDALVRARERFDLVIVDPPTYSTTRGSRWTSGKDWTGLAEKALGVLARGGRLLCCSNDRRLTEAAFGRHLERAMVQARARRMPTPTHLRFHPPPVDFPPSPTGSFHLKTAVLHS